MSPNTLLAVGLAGCATLVVVALVASRFLKSEPPPPPPPPPPTTSQTVMGQLRYTEGYYKAGLDEDAKRFALPAPSVESLAQPLVYADESAGARKMNAERDTLETAHLHLATKLVKEWAMTASGQGYKYEHMILSITNRSSRPIAYHVETSVPHLEKCKSKGHLEHNAIALKPGETEQRTECLWSPGASVTVRRIEVLELTDLGYYYVSQLAPAQVMLDQRTAAGHQVPKKGKPCGFIPWRDIQAAAASGPTWPDVMDFYARHNCDEYSFWRGYHRWTVPGSLPSHATVAAPPPAPSPDGG